MDFFERHKQMQAELYVEAATALENHLGEGYEVIVTKPGRIGRISRKRAMIQVKVGSTIIDISTNERGRELKMHVGETPPGFKDIPSLAHAIKEHIGDNFEPLTEPEPQIVEDAEEVLGPDDVQEDSSTAFIEILENMQGDGLRHDTSHTIEPQAVKANRVYKMALIWGTINRINARVSSLAGESDTIIALRERLHHWITTKVIPSKKQWEAMIQAIEFIHDQLSENEELQGEANDLNTMIETIKAENAG